MNSGAAFLLGCCAVILAACTTTYLSFQQSADDRFELIIANETELLEAVYAAIQRTFPETIITSLAGTERGFSFFTQFALDRTSYKFVVLKLRGILNGAEVEGYGFSIYGYGTQGFVKERYIEPLLAELDRAFSEKGIRRTRVRAR